MDYSSKWYNEQGWSPDLSPLSWIVIFQVQVKFTGDELKQQPVMVTQQIVSEPSSSSELWADCVGLFVIKL